MDARSDIFSFGTVLYEMVTGFRAFKGESSVSTLSAVLRDHVRPISETAPDVPLELEQIIDRCLLKNPDDRYQQMKEVEQALTVLRRHSDSGVLYRPISNPPAPPVGPVPPLSVEPQVDSQIGSRPPVGALTDPPVTQVDAPSMPQVGARSPQAERGARKDLIFGILCLLILVIAVLGIWWYVQHRPAPQATTSQVPSSTQSPAAPPTPAPEVAPPVDLVLTNDSIIEMVQARVAPSVIVSHIRSTKTKFNFSTAEVIRLSKAGVPEIVINAMRDPKAASAAAPPKPVTPIDGAPPPKNGAREALLISVDDGLPFGITLDQDVPIDAPQGESLRFIVTVGLKVDDALVIAKGASVTGSIVSEPGKKKFLGMGGKMTFRLEKVDAVDGQKISVRAAPKRRAEGATTRPLDAGKGAKSKELAAARGTQYIGYIDGQQTVSVRK